MQYSGIYGIVNIFKDKIYVGSATRIYNRLSVHKSYLKKGNHENSYLQAAYNKYGAENFIFVVLEVCEKDTLEIKEQWWANELRSNHREHGYNLRKIAKSNFGVKFSEETKIKISNSKKGKPLSEEHKATLRVSQKNRPPISAETRWKLALAKSNQSEETRRKNSEANKGKIISEETKQKMKNAWIARRARDFSHLQSKSF